MTKQDILKCLTFYLPYNLMVKHSGNITLPVTYEKNKDWTTQGFSVEDVVNYHYLKPLLRPISTLSSADFELNIISKNAILFLDETANLPFNSRKEHVKGIMWGDMEFLLKNHFDIFGLIKEGAAEIKTDGNETN